MEYRMQVATAPRCALWLAAAWLAFAGSASAQEEPPQFDVLIGITRASYHAERLQLAPSGNRDLWVPARSGSRISPTLGAGVSVPLASVLSLRSEVLFVRKGVSSPSVVLDEIFVEFPLLVVLEMNWKDPIRLRAVAGLAPSLELRCSAKVAPPVSNGSGGGALADADCEDFRSESGDMGNVIGGGFGPFRVAGLSIMPEVRVVLGGADLLSDRTREKARHQTVSLLFGVTR
jgi:hypothetical protein